MDAAVSSSAECTVLNQRFLPYPPPRVFAAFADAQQLARWWGPAGFTNTFEIFEFRPGGRWLFTMHAPNGANFANDSVFRETTEPSRVVIEHVVTPWYLLTVTLAEQDGGTQLEWRQVFENPEIAAKMRVLAETANEQVLDRLAAVLG